MSSDRLTTLLKQLRGRGATEEELQEQRRSWVRGETAMGLDRDEAAYRINPEEIPMTEPSAMENDYRTLVGIRNKLTLYEKSLYKLDKSQKETEEQVRLDIQVQFLQSELEKLRELYPQLLQEFVNKYNNMMPKRLNEK